eukprot:1188443-Prorocentrum_minimum.AAC.1
MDGRVDFSSINRLLQVAVSSPDDEVRSSEQCRCLVPVKHVQAGGVRYDYTHSIRNCDLLHDRRVSITFREVPEQERPLYGGVRYVPMRDRFKWGRQL